MSLPYFPMFPSDFEAKTSHLTLAEDGAYNRLLRVCWMTPGCTIPDDEAWIMRRCRATTKADKEAVRNVLAEFFAVSNGRYSNAKLLRVFREANEAHEKRKNAGAKGGKAKSLKTNDTGSSNAVAKLKQPEPEPEPDTLGGGGSAGASFREKVLEAAGHDQSGITANGKIVGGQADFASFSKACADLNISEGDAVAVVAEVSQQKRDGPAMSLSYFVEPLRRFAGARDAAPVSAVVSLHGPPTRASPQKASDILREMRARGEKI